MRALLAAALLALAGCASVPPAQPTAVDHGVLLVRARVRGAVLSFLSDWADRAAVVEVDADGVPIPGKVAASGAAFQGGGVAFLDLPPGRYALTGVSFLARGARYAVAIPEAESLKRVVELRPGSAAFLGELSLDGRFPDFDVAVSRSFPVVLHWLTPFLPRPVVPRDADLRGRDMSPAAEARALRDARAALARTQWPPRFAARLRELNAPAPAATRGTIRRKELPLRPESILSWRDTLRWGEPARGRRALAWRRPAGTARAAVFFTSATAEGFIGYDEAVRQLRAAAGALDDPAAVYEVFVGTRTGTGARVTSYVYPESTLVGSETKVFVTETVLVPDAAGMYTARLRAERSEFAKVLPEFREFLRQLTLGAPVKAEPKPEPELLLP